MSFGSVSAKPSDSQLLPKTLASAHSRCVARAAVNSSRSFKTRCDALRRRTTDQWLSRLGSARAPAAPVNTVSAALRDKQLEARETLVAYEHRRWGRVTQIRSPLRLSGGSVPMRRRANLDETQYV